MNGSETGAAGGQDPVQNADSDQPARLASEGKAEPAVPVASSGEAKTSDDKAGADASSDPKHPANRVFVKFIEQKKHGSGARRNKVLQFHLIDEEGNEVLAATGEDQGDAHYHYMGTSELMQKYGELDCHNRRRLLVWLEMIIKESQMEAKGEVEREINKLGEHTKDNPKGLYYVGHHQKKSTCPDGRRQNRWYLEDQFGTFHLAVEGLERDTRDGHYVYHAKEPFASRTPLNCGNMKEVLHWMEAWVTHHAPESHVHVGLQASPSHLEATGKYNKALESGPAGPSGSSSGEQQAKSAAAAGAASAQAPAASPSMPGEQEVAQVKADPGEPGEGAEAGDAQAGPPEASIPSGAACGEAPMQEGLAVPGRGPPGEAMEEAQLPAKRLHVRPPKSSAKKKAPAGGGGAGRGTPLGAASGKKSAAGAAGGHRAVTPLSAPAALVRMSGKHHRLGGAAEASHMKRLKLLQEVTEVRQRAVSDLVLGEVRHRAALEASRQLLLKHTALCWLRDDPGERETAEVEGCVAALAAALDGDEEAGGEESQAQAIRALRCAASCWLPLKLLSSSKELVPLLRRAAQLPRSRPVAQLAAHLLKQIERTTALHLRVLTDPALMHDPLELLEHKLAEDEVVIKLPDESQPTAAASDDLGHAADKPVAPAPVTAPQPAAAAKQLPPPAADSAAQRGEPEAAAAAEMSLSAAAPGAMTPSAAQDAPATTGVAPESHPSAAGAVPAAAEASGRAVAAGDASLTAAAAEAPPIAPLDKGSLPVSGTKTLPAPGAAVPSAAPPTASASGPSTAHPHTPDAAPPTSGGGDAMAVDEPNPLGPYGTDPALVDSGPDLAGLGPDPALGDSAAPSWLSEPSPGSPLLDLLVDIPDGNGRGDAAPLAPLQPPDADAQQLPL